MTTPKAQSDRLSGSGEAGTGTRRQLHPSKPNPELDRLMEATRGHTITPAELREQRRSWVRGEMLLAHPEMTAEEVNAILDEIDPPLQSASPAPVDDAEVEELEHEFPAGAMHNGTIAINQGDLAETAVAFQYMAQWCERAFPIIRRLRSQLASVEARDSTSRDLLQEARNQFAFYANNHRIKADLAEHWLAQNAAINKAAVNEKWVERIDAHLSPSPPVSASPSEGKAEPVACEWVIRKNGYFYRPNRAGYTSSIAEAGRYTQAAAEAEARIEAGITAHRASEFAARPTPPGDGTLRFNAPPARAEQEIAIAASPDPRLEEARRLLGRAMEELRLIRMKDSGAVYDTTIRIEADAFLSDPGATNE